MSGLHDELSALLDDELDDGERTELEGRLAEDAGLAAELTRTAEIRSALRDLPEVDPPVGALEEVVNAIRAIEHGQRRRRRRRLVGSGAAMTAVALLVVAAQVTVPAAAVTPDLETAVGLHEAMNEVDAGGGAGLRSTHFVDGDDRVHRGFGRSDGRLVSVFSEPGRVDWDGLGGGSWSEVAGAKAWVGTVEGAGAVVVERQGVIVVVVGANDLIDDPTMASLVEQASASGGAQDQTWLDRFGEFVGIG